MPQRDRIEDTFKGRLGNFEYPIDEQAGWADLASQLPERTRRSRWGWWLMSGLLLLLTGTLLGYFTGHLPVGEEPVSTPEHLSTTQVAISDQQSGRGSVASAKIAAELPSTTTSTTATAATSADTESAVAVATNEASPKSAVAERILAEGEIEVPTQKITTVPNPQTVDGSAGLEENVLNPNAIATTSTDAATHAISDTPNASLAASTEARSVMDAVFLPASELSLLSIPAYDLEGMEASVPRRRRRRGSDFEFWVEPYAAYGIVSAENTARTADMPPVSVADFEQAHELQENLTYGLRAGVVLQEHWTASLGLERQRLQEAFSFSATDVEQSQVYYDSAKYQVQPNGDIVYFGDTVTLTTTTMRRVKGYPTITRWEIPLTVGYQQRWDRLSLGGEIGLSLNMSRSFEGTTLDSLGVITTFDDASPAYLEDNLGLSYLLGAHVGYELFPQVDLVAGLRYQHSSKVWTTAVAPIDRKFQVLHVRAGVRVRFGG